MAKLGRKRMNHLKGRFGYILCDFGKQAGAGRSKGRLRLVSSIAINNVRSAETIRNILPGDFFIGRNRRLFPEFRSHDPVAPRAAEMAERCRFCGREMLMA
jgi:hypothetical protein